MAALVTAAGRMVKAIRCDDDFADRLNFRFTPTIIVMFAILVTTKQFYKTPIQCWTPAHFAKEHKKYANEYCWIRNTYRLPFEQYIPPDGPGGNNETILGERDGQTIGYYQWIPLLLLIQAFLFYLPCEVWQSFGDQSGVDVGNLIESGQLIATVQMESGVRKKIVRKMVHQINRYLTCEVGSRDLPCRSGDCTLSLKHILVNTCCFLCGRSRANYLVLLYLFTKVLYLFNVISQLFLLNLFLGTDYHSYGPEVLSAVISGDEWAPSRQFPRVTMCNLKVRRLGNVHRYTIQCVLPINLFSEKIYLFLWFWMIFVALTTGVSLVAWILRMVVRKDRHRYVRRYLNLAGKIKLRDFDDMKRMAEFTEKYLRQDGVFLLRMVTAAANALTAVDLTGALWTRYWKNRPQPDDMTGINGPLDYTDCTEQMTLEDGRQNGNNNKEKEMYD